MVSFEGDGWLLQLTRRKVRNSRKKYSWNPKARALRPACGSAPEQSLEEGWKIKPHGPARIWANSFYQFFTIAKCHHGSIAAKCYGFVTDVHDLPHRAFRTPMRFSKKRKPMNRRSSKVLCDLNVRR